MSSISLSEVCVLKVKITPENFCSTVAALEVAFPFLQPFENTLCCCFAYILPTPQKIGPRQLEAVITRWRNDTGEQMTGTFSMSMGALFAMAKGGKTETDAPDLSQTVEFNPYKGEPDQLCKLKVSVSQEDDGIIPLVTINLIAAEEIRKQQIVAFASTIDTAELDVVLAGGEERTVAPGEIV